MEKYLSIDVGGTFVKYGYITKQGDILEKGLFPTQKEDFQLFLSDLDNVVNKYRESIQGIAISMPGRINQSEGIAITGGALRFIDKTPLVNILENRYHLPVSIANDGHCAAKAELWIGSLKNCQNGLCLVFGTGIGGAIIVNGNIVEGSHFSSGELSCLITDYSQPDLEHYLGTRCSTKALLRKYSKQHQPTLSGYDFFNKINHKEERALNIYHTFLKEVASAIYSIQCIIDCEKVAIGGGISGVEFLVNDIDDALSKQFVVYEGFPIEKPDVVKCFFENDANLIGALKYHLDKGV